MRWGSARSVLFLKHFDRAGVSSLALLQEDNTVGVTDNLDLDRGTGRLGLLEDVFDILQTIAMSNDIGEVDVNDNTQRPPRLFEDTVVLCPCGANQRDPDQCNATEFLKELKSWVHRLTSSRIDGV